jgi:Phosphate/sulphate permeases
MDISIIIFLLGGLFLGWSLGANDAANVFGTAVEREWCVLKPHATCV